MHRCGKHTTQGTHKFGLNVRSTTQGTQIKFQPSCGQHEPGNQPWLEQQTCQNHTAGKAQTSSIFTRVENNLQRPKLLRLSIKWHYETCILLNKVLKSTTLKMVPKHTLTYKREKTSDASFIQEWFFHHTQVPLV